MVKRNKNFNYGNTEFNIQFKNIIIVTVIVLVSLGLFYLLTVALLGKKPKVNTSGGNNSTEIQTQEILLGSSFDVSSDKYIVLYYDSTDEDIASDIKSLVSSYRSKDESLSLYTVDLSDALNKPFVSSEESNPDASNASELKVKNPTLIVFENGKINEYVESFDSVKNYLS